MTHADMMEQQTPLACVRGAIASDEREAHFQLIDRLFREAKHARLVPGDLPNGYEYQFQPNALEEIARFIANERLCCPFLVFNLRVEANASSIALRISGPPGTRDFLDAEL